MISEYLAGLPFNTALVQGDQLYALNQQTFNNVNNVQCRISKSLTKEYEDAGLIKAHMCCCLGGI